MKFSFIDRSRFAAAALLAAFVLTVLAPPAALKAEGDGGLRIHAKTGFQGLYKGTAWIPVTLSLTNETGKDMAGEAVVSVWVNGMTTDYVIPAELPRGSTVELPLAIPGMELNKDSTKIRFFEGSFGKGKSVPLQGTDYLEGRASSGYMIGVVARDPDTLNFMPSLNQKGYHISVVPIKPEELPKHSIMLDMLDALVLNDTATAGWDASRVEAVQNWTAEGGTLILSGGAGYGKTAEAFAELSPVAVEGTMELPGTEALSAAGGTELAANLPVTISKGRLTEGRIEWSEQGVPLAANREYGMGEVVYVAFDPSLEPMSVWAGSAQLWARLLQNTLTPLQQLGGIQFHDQIYWNIGSLIDYFPSIKPPNFMLLMLLLGIYMLLVAPVLYIVLAKLDRREWAWWAIPAVSLAMAAVIFLIGAGDKRVMNAHTIEIIELTKDGKAVMSGATGLFVPAGGTVTAEYGRPLPLKLYAGGNVVGRGGSGGLNASGNHQVRLGEAGNSAVWRSVSYWSTRKLWMERSLAPESETGMLEVRYEEEGGDWRIVVTNQTTADLQHVSLLSGGLVQPIGDLKRGESGTVDLLPSISSMTGQYFNYGHHMFPYPANRRDDEFSRERNLTDLYFNRSNGSIMPSRPAIVAFSKDRDSGYLVGGNKVKADRLRMWVKELGPAPQEENRVVVPAGAMKPIVTSNTMQTFDQYGNGEIRVGGGELVLDYLAPDAFGVAYDAIKVQVTPGYPGSDLKYAIWNERSGEWQPIEGDLGDPTPYMTEGGTIRVRLEAGIETETAIPLVELEGEKLAP